MLNAVDGVSAAPATATPRDARALCDRRGPQPCPPALRGTITAPGCSKTLTRLWPFHLNQILNRHRNCNMTLYITDT